MTGEAGFAVSGCESKQKRHIIEVAGKVYMQKKETIVC
jgi:hypothetical protein